MRYFAFSAFSIAVALHGCGEAVRIPGLNGGSPAEIKAIYRSCYNAQGERGAMIEAAMQSAKSADYAARSKTAAEVCMRGRRKLFTFSSQQPCIPLLISQEAVFWAMNNIFEGRASPEPDRVGRDRYAISPMLGPEVELDPGYDLGLVNGLNFPTSEEVGACFHSMGLAMPQ